MTVMTGGLRKRLIKDSLYRMITQALSDLGWMDPNRRHLPINFITDAVHSSQEVPLNTLALADENEQSQDGEIGSNLTLDNWTFYLDFYAENDALGLHLSSDLADILRGKITSIGRDLPMVIVFDYTAVSPVEIFRCDIENVVRDRAHDFPKNYQKHWYSVRFEVIDDNDSV